MTTATQDGRPSRWLGPGLAFPASLVVLVIIMIPILQLARYSFNHFDPVEMMQQLDSALRRSARRAVPVAAKPHCGEAFGR